MERYLSEFVPPPRLLMGAGPSNVHPRVLRAMSASPLGHLDPDFLLAMDDVRSMLREVFQTGNALTIPISGTGTAAMEAALVNMLEPGDNVVIATNGYFGIRLVEIGKRCGANVFEVAHPYGSSIDLDSFRKELSKHESVKIAAVVHAETSSGVCTPLPEISKMVHDVGALFVVDAVTSLGGVELRVDEWEIDICYSGTQKCLGAPPGLAPITLNDRALEVMDRRTHPVQSFYLDLTMLRGYWQQRAYHHTAPVSMIYSLREALRLIMEEGIENRWQRHTVNAKALGAGLRAIGLDIVADEHARLPSLTAIRVPAGVAEADVRAHLLQKHNLEISGGLGDLSGQVWRVGLMGHNSTQSNVFTFLAALEEALMDQGFELPVGASLSAAQQAIQSV